MQPTASSEGTTRPTSLLGFFLTLNWMALQGFGGVLTVAQRILCEQKKWLTPKQFAEDWAVSQVLPGPNIVNLSIVLGDRYFGIRGAFVAVLGLFLAPLILVLIVATLYNQFTNIAVVTGAVKGMGAVAAGMIGAVGLKLFVSIKTSSMGRMAFGAVAAASFVMVALLRIPLIWTIVLIGIPSVFWTYRQLRKQARSKTGSGS